MKTNVLFLSGLLLCVAFTAPIDAQTAKPAPFDKTRIETYVRHLLGVNPQAEVIADDPKPSPLSGFQEVNVHLKLGPSSQENVFYLSANGQYLVQGPAYKLDENPFAATAKKLHFDNAPTLGNPKAPVTLLIYSDFECPICAQESQIIHKELPEAYGDKLYVVFKNRPLTEIHPWSRPAAIAGKCAFAQGNDAFWRFHDWAYQHQNEINAQNFTAKLNEGASAIKLDPLQLQACIADPSVGAAIDAETEEAKALGVFQTPTMFLNGRTLPGGLPLAQMKGLIDDELKFGDYLKAHNSNCCSVELPALTTNK